MTRRRSKTAKRPALRRCPLCGSSATMETVHSRTYGLEFYAVCSRDRSKGARCPLSRKPVPDEDGFLYERDAAEFWNESARGSRDAEATSAVRRIVELALGRKYATRMSRGRRFVALDRDVVRKSDIDRMVGALALLVQQAAKGSDSGR